MKQPKRPDRPDFVTTEILDYIDRLRKSGVTNMFGARPRIRQAYPGLSAHEASEALVYWMETFGTRGDSHKILIDGQIVEFPNAEEAAASET